MTNSIVKYLYSEKIRFCLKFLAVIWLCLALFACGGADDDDSDPGGSNPQPTVEPSPDPTNTPTPGPDPTNTPTPSPDPTNTPTPTPDPDAEDGDHDGVVDEYDLCPDTPAWRDVDQEGCPFYEIVGDCIPTEEEEAMIIAHNEARAESRFCGDDFKQAVPPVRWDCQLATAARLHSEDMTDNNFFSHTGSNGSTPFERMHDAGYQWRTAGENIIAGYRTVESAVEGWLESPGHCNNIMGGGFEDMGAGKSEASNTKYGVYWTAGFATRQ